MKRKEVDMKAAIRVTVAVFFLNSLWVGALLSQTQITDQQVFSAQSIMGLEFSESQRDSMLDELHDNLKYYEQMRDIFIGNEVVPALYFNPLPIGFKIPSQQISISWGSMKTAKLPENLDDLAFYSIRELAGLIHSRAISSEALTRFFLERLKKYDSQLHCVITLTEDLALEQARRADREIAAGQYRGLLHGIPYGAKDLLAVRGYKTTWGAMPYKDQLIDMNATVIQKLEDAGAILIAKLSLGALAWGDVWFGGKTRNPWNVEQGSSGSSAGSASATAAGLVPFAIGTETWGSIVSPSTRCGTTGLRPTFGRVSRYGAMALSWSMDKIGPICRSVEDCAIVFNAIRGADEMDPTVRNAAFNYKPDIRINTLRIGYLEDAFEQDTVNFENNNASLEKLRQMGIELIPIELPDLPVYALSIILSAEAAAAFDDLTRSGKDSLLVRQIKNAWPNVFRASRFIPAVEYIQANRLRTRLIEDMQRILQEVDVYVTPSFGDNLLLTNLTGHPCVVLPNGFNAEGSPTSISFMGNLYDEASVLAVAKAYQDATDFHLQHPPAFK